MTTYTTIDGLLLAATILDSMQLETDIGGAVSNKITIAQLREFIQSAVVEGDFNVSDWINAGGVRASLEPILITPSATYMGFNFSIFDNKSSFINHSDSGLGGFEFLSTQNGTIYHQVLDIDGQGNAEFKGGVRASKPLIAVNTASKTLFFSFLGGGDQNSFLKCNSSNPQTITIPPHSTHAFPINTDIDIYQEGTGQVTISPGAGVTINSRSGYRKIIGQHGKVSLKKTDTNVWALTGDLGA